MKKLKSTLLIFVALLILGSLLGACSPASRPGPTQPNPEMQAPQVQQSNQDSTKAKAIAERVDKDVQEINSASVVISGNQAWVGVDAYANAQVTAQVKERISGIVKEMEPGVQTVYVTADADTVTRLRKIANDIAAGKPVSGFVNELAEIAGRIAPTPR